MRKLEKDIEQKFVAYARSKRCKCVKFKDTVGAPDRLVHLPGGYGFYIEFKRKGEKPGFHQIEYRNDLMERDIESFVVDSFEEAKKILDDRLLFQVSRVASVIWEKFGKEWQGR